MSFLWLSDLVRLVLKEIYCRMSKELHWSLDCFKLLTKKNMSCNSRVIIRGSRCSFMRRLFITAKQICCVLSGYHGCSHAVVIIKKFT